jgi:hypothetical protein
MIKRKKEKKKTKRIKKTCHVQEKEIPIAKFL